MNKYIGFKMIQAEPMTHGQYSKEKYGESQLESVFAKENKDTLGYKVVYADGYVSWSPKEVFEKAYMQIADNNTITEQNVESFMKKVEVTTIGEKTTLVVVTLSNGYVITESSSCVDPANYNESLGASICIEKIKNKVWGYLGFLLHTAKNGI